MKVTKVIAFLFLIIVCSGSIASAQLQLTEVNRSVISRLYFEDSGDIISYENDRSLKLGDYSADVELAAGDGLLTSAQSTLITNEGHSMAYMGGHMDVSIDQPAIDFPNGMDSGAGLEIVYTSPYTCDYFLAGMVSGPGLVTLEIIDWSTWEVIFSESWTETEFSTSGQLSPGTYSFHYSLLDFVIGNEPVSRYSECDFEITMAPQVPVATEEISFGAVKALFR